MFLPTLGDGGNRRIDQAPSHRTFRRPAHFGLGLLLLGAAIVILAWQEASTVGALRDSGRLAKAVTEVSGATIDPLQDGRLVHLSGILVTKQLLRDPAMGVSEAGLVRLRRTVEMFQWRESRQASVGDLGANEASRATYSYAKKWSEEAIDSTRFNASLHHENPPMPIRTEYVTARDAAIGDRVLAAPLVATLDAFEPLAPPSNAPAGFVRTTDGLYKGANADAPEIGDIRVSIAGVPVQPVSVVAEQQGASLVPARTEDGGKGVAQVAPGYVSATTMVVQREGGSLRPWLVRGACLILLALAVMFLSRAFSPVAGTRTYLLMLCLAGAMAMATAGFAWTAFRPPLGLAMIAGAVLLVVLAYRRLRYAQSPERRAPRTVMTAR